MVRIDSPGGEKRRGSAAIAKVGVAAALLVAALLVVLVSWPQVLGLQRTLGFAQLIAFRAPLAIGLGSMAVILAVIAIFRRRRNPVLAWGLALILAGIVGLKLSMR